MTSFALPTMSNSNKIATLRSRTPHVARLS
jgi:hypothetical protein